MTNGLCPKCGTVNQPGSAFCKKCGSSLNVQPSGGQYGSSPQPVNYAPPYVPPQKKKLSMKMVAIGVIAVIVVIVLIAATLNPGSPSNSTPSSVKTLYVGSQTNQYQCYFALQDNEGNPVRADGNARLQLEDDLGAVLYNTTITVEKSDFEWVSTLLGQDYLAYVWYVPYSQITKSDSRSFTLEATLVFSQGSIILNGNTTALVPADLKNPNTPPVANINGPLTGWTGIEIAFSATASTDINEDYLSYDWDFGDGKTQGYGSTANHIFEINGTITVTVTVSDNYDGVDSASYEITLNHPEEITYDSGYFYTNQYSAVTTYYVNITMTNVAPMVIDVSSYSYDVWFDNGVMYNGYSSGAPSQLAAGATASWTLTFYDVPSNGTPVRIIYDDRVEVPVP